MSERPTHDELVESLRENWSAEIQSARTYRELATAEKNERKKGVLLRMAEAEERDNARYTAHPWISSFSAAASTAAGALIPIVPFFFMGGFAAVIAAFAVSIEAAVTYSLGLCVRRDVELPARVT